LQRTGLSQRRREGTAERQQDQFDWVQFHGFSGNYLHNNFLLIAGNSDLQGTPGGQCRNSPQQRRRVACHVRGRGHFRLRQLRHARDGFEFRFLHAELMGCISLSV
jgi:hypothetical protein